jgi:hypothetical protein
MIVALVHVGCSRTKIDGSLLSLPSKVLRSPFPAFSVSFHACIAVSAHRRVGTLHTRTASVDSSTLNARLSCCNFHLHHSEIL